MPAATAMSSSPIGPWRRTNSHGCSRPLSCSAAWARRSCSIRSKSDSIWAMASADNMTVLDRWPTYTTTMRPCRPCISLAAASSARLAGGEPSYPTKRWMNPVGGMGLVIALPGFLGCEFCGCEFCGQSLRQEGIAERIAGLDQPLRRDPGAGQELYRGLAQAEPQHGGWHAEPGPVPAADGGVDRGGEDRIGDRLRGGQVDRAADVLALQQEPDRADLVGQRDPA